MGTKLRKAVTADNRAKGKKTLYRAKFPNSRRIIKRKIESR